MELQRIFTNQVPEFVSIEALAIKVDIVFPDISAFLPLRRDTACSYVVLTREKQPLPPP